MLQGIFNVKVEFHIEVKHFHELLSFYTKYTGGQTPLICSTLECVFIEYTEWAYGNAVYVYRVGMYTAMRCIHNTRGHGHVYAIQWHVHFGGKMHAHDESVPPWMK